MKYIRIIFFICAIFTLFSQKMSAQDNKIIVTATVIDAQGNNVPGAIILNDKNHTTAIANQSGEFSIAALAKSLLSVTATGYKAGFVEASTNLKTIVLKSIKSDLVQVAFNQVNKADLLGGVSTFNVADMLETNYTTFSLDNLASYIPGYHGNIWGMNSKLVIVDGIPRDEYNVIPSEIDQITVLKSASAVALYGSRASKGVVSITTKRGVANENKFKVRVNTGVLVPKRYAEYLGSAEYMNLYNEALTNDNNGVLPSTGFYSQSDINGSAAGKNIYRYPNLDFYSSDNLKKFANRSEVVTEYSGGNDRTRFYVNVGNYRVNSLLNVGNGKKEGENRFNVRGNLDVKLSNTITSKINTSVTFYDGATAQGNYWGNAATLRPNVLTPLIPVSYLQNADTKSQAYPASSSFLIDGKYLLAGTSNQSTNPFADIYTRGTITNTTRKYQFDASLNFNLASVLKGLSFDTQFGIDYNTSYARTLGDNTYAVYQPTWNAAGGNDTIKSLTKIGSDNATYSQGISASYQRQTMFFSGALKYNNTFNEDHNVSAILLAHAYTLSESAVYHAVANANIGLQASYNYKQKYYVDFTGNVVHSSRLASNQSNAFSPTVSLGWRITNEDFLSKSDIVNDLKLTASAGILNTDLDYDAYANSTNANGGYYLSQISYSDQGDYFSWQEGRQLRSTIVTRNNNTILGFEKRRDVNFGIETSLFKNAIQINASYFYSKLEGIPIQATSIYPNYLLSGSTSFLPYVNYNADSRKGFDLGVNFNKRVGKVDLTVGMVATYYDATASQRSEIYKDSYLYRQGKPMDAIFGLKSEGFFSTADIAAMTAKAANAHVPQSWGTVHAGDIKYVDVNNDGVVDDKDQVYLGRGGYSGSPLNLGLNVTAKWNNFSLFVLANSSSGSIGIKNSSYYWSAGTTGKYSAAMRDRWTEATAETATYPRLTATSGDNNFRTSDFWLYKNDRINLAKIQLSYDIPAKLLKKTFIKNLGLYINGNDLLLIAKEKKLMETNIGSTPQVRYYSVGVKAEF